MLSSRILAGSIKIIQRTSDYQRIPFSLIRLLRSHYRSRYHWYHHLNLEVPLLAAVLHHKPLALLWDILVVKVPAQGLVRLLAGRPRFPQHQEDMVLVG